jgi:hypothetical protein
VGVWLLRDLPLGDSVFERHHRFVGWFGLICTWVFVILDDSYDFDAQRWDADGVKIVSQQEFWFVAGITVLIIEPWVTVRKVKVDVEIVSSPT